VSLSFGSIGTSLARIGTGLAGGGILGGLTAVFGGGRSGPPSPVGSSGLFGGGGGPVPYGTGVNRGPFIPVPGAIGKSGPGPAATSCPKGYHLNKHALAACRRHGAVGARTICVRNRKMNPLNPRALTRSLRREKRAGKIIKRLHVFRPIRHHAQEQRRLTSGKR